MNLKELFTEDRGVSPVIGVILMVAITVILAAVIGAFVLQIGGDLGESAPQASISVSDTNADENSFELRHSGGDTIEWDETQLVVEGPGDDDTIQWTEPVDAAFSTSDRATVITNNDTEDPDNGESELQVRDIEDIRSDNDDDEFELNNDDRVTVTMIDRPSGEIIFERTFRV